MRIAVAAVVAILATGATLCADEIWVGKLPYRNVHVVDCRGGSIVFDMSGRRITKPLAGVSRVVIANTPALNQAEELFAAGKYAEAVVAYQRYLQTDARSWKAALALQRKIQAEGMRIDSAKPSTPAATQPATSRPAGRKCPHCRGGGWVACPDCKLRGRSTGKGRCRRCKATGRTTCTRCGGDWRSRKCRTCGGDGRITVRRYEGVYVRTSSRKCSSCSGTGYCAACCRNRHSRGTVPCRTCKGSGLDGTCSRCAGLKKVPCTHCPGGAAHAGKAPARPAAASDKGTPELDEVLKSTPPAPDVSGMTSLQADLARAEHEKKCDKLRQSLVGRQVAWTLEVMDVVSGDAPSSPFRMVRTPALFQPGTITIVARSDSGFPVHAVFPGSRVKELAEYRMGQLVTVTGKVGRWLKLSPGILNPTRALELAGSAVEPASTSKGPLWVSGGARSVVYIVDGRATSRLRYADMRRGLTESIGGLDSSQRFEVVLWGPTVPQSILGSSLASPARKKQVIALLDGYRPTGTGKDGSIRRALERYVGRSYVSSRTKGLKAVYLLLGSDFHDPNSVLETLRTYASRRAAQIHTVQCGRLSPQSEDLLKQIAAENGGRFGKLP